MVQRSYVPSRSSNGQVLRYLTARPAKMDSLILRYCLFLFLAEKLAFVDGDASAPTGTIDGRCRWGQGPQFQQQFSQPRALFQIHIDKFKSHGLRARTTDDGLRFDIPDT